MQITIRRIVNNDVAVLAEIARQTFYDTFTGTCTKKDMQDFLNEYFNEERLLKEISDNDNFNRPDPDRWIRLPVQLQFIIFLINISHPF